MKILAQGCTNPLWFVRPDTTLKELYERLDEVSVFKFINKV
jgi:hypothetical protein